LSLFRQDFDTADDCLGIRVGRCRRGCVTGHAQADTDGSARGDRGGDDGAGGGVLGIRSSLKEGLLSPVHPPRGVAGDPGTTTRIKQVKPQACIAGRTVSMKTKEIYGDESDALHH
jgi:hypothetical protein